MSGQKSISAVIVALALLAGLDICLAFTHPLARVPIASLERSEVYQAVEALSQEKGSPDVVLLGSSLVTAPALQSEALYIGHTIPRFRHRRVHILEQELARTIGWQPTVFCLGTGGQMASDAYLVTKNVLKGSKQPLAIIYGVAPRDFQDNRVQTLESTPAFQTLATLDDLGERMQSPPYRLKPKTDLFLGRISALWRDKTDMRVYAVLRIKKYMERLLPWVCFAKYNEKHELKVQKHGLFPEEAAGEPTAWPGAALDHLSVDLTMEDYRFRYNPVSSQSLATQFTYFEKLIKVSKQRGITLLIANMPLSASNRELMEPGFYQSFVTRVSKLCLQNQVEYIDLNSPEYNDINCYADSVHLKPALSSRFLAQLASATGRTKVASTLNRSRQSLAQSGQSL